MLPNSVITWNGLAQKFLEKYFPPAKLAKLRMDIVTFKQEKDEILSEAWDRFKDLLQICPHHGIQSWVQIQIFNNGLQDSTRHMVDSSANGSLLRKSYRDSYALLENMAASTYQLPSDGSRSSGLLQLDAVSSIKPILTLYQSKFKDFSCQLMSTPLEQSEIF